MHLKGITIKGNRIVCIIHKGYFIRKWLDVKFILKEYFRVSEGWELMLFDVTDVKPDETDEH